MCALISTFATQKLYSFWTSISPQIFHVQSYKFHKFMFVVNLCLVWCCLCAKSCVNKKKVNNFSHTTGSHAKPNHTAWPLFIQQNVTKQYKKTNGYTHYKLKHLKRAIVRPHKGFTTKKKGETRGIKHKKLTSLQRVGGREVRLKERQHEKLHASCDLDPPHTLAPRLPDVCEKNIFCFIRSSASRKQHLLCQQRFAYRYLSLILITSLGSDNNKGLLHRSSYVTMDCMKLSEKRNHRKFKIEQDVLSFWVNAS